ncbi:MAG: hypothetical protein AAF580_11995 [Pseudomonadota bacterium]
MRTGTGERISGLVASDDNFSWQALKTRVWNFTRNVIGFEARLNDVVRKTDAQQDIINDLAKRLDRIEAQHELIIRLLDNRTK